MAALPLVYVSGFLAQLMENYTLWREMGGVPGDGTSPALPKTEIVVCMVSVFSLSGLKALLGITAGIGLLFLMLWYRDRENSRGYDSERNFHYSEKGTYGTARFMTVDEMKGLLDVTSVRKTIGTILGAIGSQIISIPPDTFMNQHIAVYGASGSMKSRTFVRNMIFQSALRGDCIVLTDPKGELYEDMALYLEDKGYEVRVFNLVHPENSDRWNCLAEINQDEILAQICVEIIFTNTGDDMSKGFWDRAETNLLKALILYVDTEKLPEDRNMGTVYDMLVELSEKELENIFSILPKGHPARKPYNVYKKSDTKVRADTIGGLGTRLQVFQSQKICDMTAADDFVFSRMGWEKCAYFVIASDQDSTFDFLSSLFFSFLFVRLVRYADDRTEDRKLPIGVKIIMDEAPNIGKIADFKKKISTVRSRNIGISIIFQNLAQLKNRYPNDEWQEIIGNCDTQIALGCNDEMTAKFISNRTGDVTIAVSSESKHLHTWRMTDYTPEYRETSSVGRRKLMTPDEILRMPLDEALVILRGQNVFKVKKFDYTKHPESKKLKKRKAVGYIPLWRREQAEIQAAELPKKTPAPKTAKKKVAEKEKVLNQIPKENLMRRKKGGVDDVK